MNEDEIKKMCDSIRSESLIKDIKLEDGHISVTTENDKSILIPIDSNLYNTDIKVCCTEAGNYSVGLKDDGELKACDASISANNAYVADSSPAYTTSTSTGHLTATARTFNTNAVANTVLINEPEQNSIVGELVLNDGTPLKEALEKAFPKTKYFIEEDYNFDVIAREFAEFYVGRITSMTGRQSVFINFFGIKDREIAVYIDTLDPFKMSIKDFFEAAAEGAKKQEFTELFGPVVCNMTVDWYTDLIESQGLFYKELYDEEDFKSLLSSHRIKRKELVTPETEKMMKQIYEASKKIIGKDSRRGHRSIWIEKAPWEEIEVNKPYIYPMSPNVPYNPNVTPNIIEPWWGIYPPNGPSTTEPMYNPCTATEITAYHDNVKTTAEDVVTATRSWYNNDVGVYASDSVLNSLNNKA